MTRALFFAAALAAGVPASAQTRVVTLNAADEVGTPILSRDGDRIAARVGKNRVAVWSVPDSKLLQDLAFADRPLSLIFGRDDQIVVALADGTIEVRAIGSGIAVRRINAPVRQSVLALSGNGRLLASAGGTGQIHLWDESGRLLHSFGHAFGNVTSLAFSPDGAQLASAGLDTDVHFWDVATGKQRASLHDRVLATFSVAFTANGKHLVIGGANGEIEVVDVQTASIARRFPSQQWAVVEVVLSPDGRSIGAAYMNIDSMALPAPLAVWDLASGRIVRRVTPQGVAAASSGFNPTGQFLYTTTKGEELSVWVLPDSTSPSSAPAPRR